MFDISFSELFIIACVALLVIGPEKLPKVARTAGAFFGRMQRFVAQVKDEVNRETRFAELQHLQQEVQSTLQQGMDTIEHSVLPPAQAVAVTIELEATPLKKPRKPRAKKTLPDLDIANAAEVSQAVDKPAAKTTSKRKTVSAETFGSALADSEEPEALENLAVLPTKIKPQQRKPRANKPTVTMANEKSVS